MRKLTATQVAAMAAAVGASAFNSARLGMPLLAFVPIAANSFDETELEEIVVTGVRPGGWDIVIFPIGGSTSPGGGPAPSPSPSPPVAQAPTNADIPVERKATRCALRYSMDFGAPGRRGEHPEFTTSFDSSGFAWGTTNPTEPAVRISASSTTPPAPGYFLIDAYTSRVNRTSTVYTQNVQLTATRRSISYETNLVNNLVHEWSHQWDGFNTNEPLATQLGNQAQAQYLQDGGDSGAPCNTRPLRNGSFGGNK
jgi:hypothetical protein